MEFVLGIIAFIGFAVGWLARAALKEAPAAPQVAEGVQPTGTGDAGQNVPRSDFMERIYTLARSVAAFSDESAHPNDLFAVPQFNEGVALFSDPATPIDQLLTYATGENATIACMALAGLEKRETPGVSLDGIIDNMPYYWAWPLYFALRCIETKGERASIGRILTRANEWWPRNGMIREELRRLLADADESEAQAFRAHLIGLTTDKVALVDNLLDTIGGSSAGMFRESIEDWRRSHVDVARLRKIGRVVECEEQSPVVEHPGLVANSDRVLQEVSRGRSVLLVGESGVGKTTVIRHVGRRLQEEGWTVFEAGAIQLIAGKKFVGEIEGQVTDAVEAAARERKVVWVIPAFHELAFAGRALRNPISVLDLLMPVIERREVVVVGETTPAGFDHAFEQYPRVATELEVLRPRSPRTDATLALARDWLAALGAGSVVSDKTIADGLQLARQHFATLVEPGNVIHLLSLALRSRSVHHGDHQITTEDLVLEVAKATGLPRVILDDSLQLDLDGLRSHFADRVVAQPEAVDCLVDRLAMIKAGLTDPTRPYGVFLFVGPTGTGKTEIAKTLASFLFGSTERLLRFDMSEFQTPESLDRLIGERDGTSDAKSLVRLIRQNPFSVVLLDEFEKAHPRVWDLFLQLFDDGRLTDRRGNTADFRHSIIILTSNLGSIVKGGPGLGFEAGSPSFSAAAVKKAVDESFRPEFLNRIDRTVIFRPLDRAAVRRILEIELRRVLELRGLRSRDWAVEWENSAIEFLLDKGYSAEMGARPLKRAIERYLLAPLAQTIVGREYPEGDQFLFVRADGDRLSVHFVDPDQPAEPDVQAIEAPPAVSLHQMALGATGTPDELASLTAFFEILKDRIESPEWQNAKTASMEAMSDSGFWSSESRFRSLSDAEFIYRTETGLQTAGSLLKRLGRGSGRQWYPSDLLRRLAHQLYLVDAACTTYSNDLPRDAVLSVEATADGSPKGLEDRAIDFARDLSEMYLSWAQKRRMRYRVVARGGESDAEYRMVMVVSGFGAYLLLKPEAGLHVFEHPGEDRSFARVRARVRVVGQPIGAEPATDTTLGDALALLRSDVDSLTSVVRRYRRDPSPLVRDAVRDWRTGNIDRVLGGDFDLIR